MKRRDALKQVGMTIGAGLIAPQLFAQSAGEADHFFRISDQLDHPQPEKPITTINQHYRQGNAGYIFNFD